MLLLKIIYLLSASVKGTISISGDTHEGGRLRGYGKNLSILLFVGFVSFILLLFWQTSPESQATEINSKWDQVTQQPIFKMGLSFLQQKERSLNEFEQAFAQVHITFNLNEYDQGRNRLIRRIVLQRSESNLSMFTLGAVDRDGKLIDKGEPFTLQSCVVKPGSWVYVSSSEDYWTDPNALTCGFIGSLRWEKMGFGEYIKTFGDISKLVGITISLPKELSHRLDFLSLVFFPYESYESFELNLERFHFKEEGKRIVTEITGKEVFEIFKNNFNSWQEVSH